MEKRAISILIPYFIENDEVYVFLQRRSTTAKRLPDFFGFFGGGIEEGESPEDALVREIKEELGINITKTEFFCRYEFYGSVKNVYLLQVKPDFDKEIILGEGQYGKFFTESQVNQEEKIINEDKLVMNNFFGKVKRGNPFLLNTKI